VTRSLQLAEFPILERKRKVAVLRERLAPHMRAEFLGEPPSRVVQLTLGGPDKPFSAEFDTGWRTRVRVTQGGQKWKDPEMAGAIMCLSGKVPRFACYTPPDGELKLGWTIEQTGPVGATLSFDGSTVATVGYVIAHNPEQSPNQIDQVALTRARAFAQSLVLATAPFGAEDFCHLLEAVFGFKSTAEERGMAERRARDMGLLLAAPGFPDARTTRAPVEDAAREYRGVLGVRSHRTYY